MNLPNRRFVLLLNQLLADEGNRHGSRQTIANRLNIGPTQVSKLLSGTYGDRGVSAKTIASAAQSLDLDSNFFYDANLGESPHYRDHLLRRRRRAPEMPSPHWHEFLLKYARIDELDDDERREIRGFLAHRVGLQSWQDYATIADWYLNRRVDESE